MTELKKQTADRGTAESMGEYAKEQLKQITTTPTAPSSRDKGDVKPKDRRRVRRRKHSVSNAHIHLMIDREPEFSNLNDREIALSLGQELGTPVSVSSVRGVRKELKKHGLYIRRLDERVEAVLNSRGIGKNGNNGHDGVPIA